MNRNLLALVGLSFLPGCSREPEPPAIAAITSATPEPTPRAVATPEPVPTLKPLIPPLPESQAARPRTYEPTAIPQTPRPASAPPSRTVRRERVYLQPPITDPAQPTRSLSEFKSEVDLLASQIENSQNRFELERLSETCSELSGQIPQRLNAMGIRHPRSSFNKLISAYQTLSRTAQLKSQVVNNPNLTASIQRSCNSARQYVLGAIADFEAAPVQ